MTSVLNHSDRDVGNSSTGGIVIGVTLLLIDLLALFLLSSYNDTSVGRQRRRRNQPGTEIMPPTQL